ncbi:MAG: gamma-glutamyl-gamma-aminobutyrate hydrolase family protein [Syntrophomonadaceae bacterium]|nr:gamma-glutamyl-gamma-aminobutyrate hydrolase family protein [Syntrophomonadaceae bacterium]MDD3897668.1 gamma-glutamyl-gamma-aminobutyrate hydrolase family protein [Syntrophomonadaceae bacterium]MDD4561690.1 gamma-glutamyl-gamma-aminobutyrate hydrolase family protein [Syntrophomonadaceae bacterium]
MRPLIGICSNYNIESEEYYLPNYYVESLLQAGAAVILLPPVKDAEIIDQYLKLCHGVVFSGGGDVDPYYWGELPRWELREINPGRDYFEIKLAQKVIARKLPAMGICRGCQVLNVAAGGTLLQDINTPMAHQQKAPRNYPFHDIVIKPDTLLSRITKESEIRVNSFHHQAVEHLGAGMGVSALAPDGIIEAIENREAPFILGVQWHPECMTDKSSEELFLALVRAAKEKANLTGR